MDSVSRYEFHAIFDRVSTTINLEHCKSATAIENCLKIARHMSKTKAKTSESEWGRKRYEFRTEEYDKLIEHNFAGRAISEAHRSPKGIIALTLTHRRREAQQRILAQKRAALRWTYAQRAPGVPRLPERPEFRRIPTRRR